MSEMSKDQEVSSEHENAGRRRLVRGAVAFAPLVLTLRSGGLLAASSLGAAVVAYGTVDNSGKITNIRLTHTDRGVTEQDRCLPVSSGTNAPRISGGIADDTNISINGVNVTCGKTRASSQSTTVTVAILSSQSVTSL